MSSKPELPPLPIIQPSFHGPVPRVGDLAGTVVEFGDFRCVLERLLGSGGHGEVYLARWEGPNGAGERVAVKVVRRDLAALIGGVAQPFLDEARLHLHLSHPNVVQVRCALQKDETYYLMMDYLEGRNLRSLLRLARRKGRLLPEAFVCHILAQVADGLDYVHRATDGEERPLHIVHRDVSPSNVFITVSGEAKLLDFGVAWSTMEDRLETRSSASIYKGKLTYLSPEQANHQSVDGRSDLFALGCILVEALTGSQPFKVGHDALVLFAIRNVTPGYVNEATPGVSRGLKTICRRLLARNPSDRYATGKEAADALRAYARDQEHQVDATSVAAEIEQLEKLPDAPRPPPAPRPRPFGMAPRGWRIAGAILAAVLLGALAASSLRYPQQRPPSVEWKTPMPSPAQEAPVKIPMEEKKPAVAPQKEATSKKLRKAARAASLCGVLATAAGCPVHVVTNTKAGDCSVAPAREIKGTQIPERLSITLVSLNGKTCLPPVNEGGPGDEPCPAEDGDIVLTPLEGAYRPVPPLVRDSLLFGQAHVVEGRQMLREVGLDVRREATGRLVALLTKMQLRDGTTFPICAALYDTGDGLAKGDPDEVLGNEGIPILDPKHLGVSATPVWGYTRVKFFWP
ncbi:MAG TPA: serine/threonine-protein kinase [Myxococcales bacterium]|nr:serine/threonine-protein kinase [Myxococcales bacterium]